MKSKPKWIATSPGPRRRCPTIWARMRFLKARAKAEKALGAQFNLRAFHDAVLELGSVPMPVLQARIDRFIADGGKGPYPEME